MRSLPFQVANSALLWESHRFLLLISGECGVGLGGGAETKGDKRCWTGCMCTYHSPRLRLAFLRISDLSVAWKAVARTGFGGDMMWIPRCGGDTSVSETRKFSSILSPTPNPPSLRDIAWNSAGRPLRLMHDHVTYSLNWGLTTSDWQWLDICCYFSPTVVSWGRPVIFFFFLLLQFVKPLGEKSCWEY